MRRRSVLTALCLAVAETEMLANLSVYLTGDREVERVPKEFAAEGPYPSPFGPRLGTARARPSWSAGEAVPERLRVTDVLGREVTSAVLRNGRGWVWAGTDAHGNLVQSGVYLIWLENNNRTLV